MLKLVFLGVLSRALGAVMPETQQDEFLDRVLLEVDHWLVGNRALTDMRFSLPISNFSFTLQNMTIRGPSSLTRIGNVVLFTQPEKALVSASAGLGNLEMKLNISAELSIYSYTVPVLLGIEDAKVGLDLRVYRNVLEPCHVSVHVSQPTGRFYFRLGSPGGFLNFITSLLGIAVENSGLPYIFMTIGFFPFFSGELERDFINAVKSVSC